MCLCACVHTGHTALLWFRCELVIGKLYVAWLSSTFKRRAFQTSHPRALRYHILLASPLPADPELSCCVWQAHGVPGHPLIHPHKATTKPWANCWSTAVVSRNQIDPIQPCFIFWRIAGCFLRNLWLNITIGWEKKSCTGGSNIGRGFFDLSLIPIVPITNQVVNKGSKWMPWCSAIMIGNWDRAGLPIFIGNSQVVDCSQLMWLVGTLINSYEETY